MDQTILGCVCEFYSDMFTNYVYVRQSHLSHKNKLDPDFMNLRDYMPRVEMRPYMLPG